MDMNQFGLSVFTAEEPFFKLGGNAMQGFFFSHGQVLHLFHRVFESMPARRDDRPAPERPLTPERGPPPRSPSRSADSYSSEEVPDEEVRVEAPRPKAPEPEKKKNPREGGREAEGLRRRGRSKSPRRGHRRRRGEGAERRREAPREKEHEGDRSTSASTITRAARHAKGKGSTKGKSKDKQKKIQCDKCGGWYARDGMEFHQKTSEYCIACQVHAKQEKKDWESAKQAAYEIRWRRNQDWKEEQRKVEAEASPERSPRDKVAKPTASDARGHGEPGTRRRRRAEPRAEDARRRAETREEDTDHKRQKHSKVFSPERYPREGRRR